MPGEFIGGIVGVYGDRRWKQYVATVADLPATGEPGETRYVQDGGSGEPALALWDPASASWVFITITFGPGGGISEDLLMAVWAFGSES